MSTINHFLAEQFIYLTLLISPHKSILLVFGSCLVLFSELSNLSISTNVYNIPDGAVLAPIQKVLISSFRSDLILFSLCSVVLAFSHHIHVANSCHLACAISLRSLSSLLHPRFLLPVIPSQMPS